jgi:hypothetical protein
MERKAPWEPRSFTELSEKSTRSKRPTLPDSLNTPGRVTGKP